MRSSQIIYQQLHPQIEKIQHHPLYAEIVSLRELRIFMEHHVFAVWDFMCLLKELQRRLVRTQAPWFPPRDAYSARLIHQILVDEEGDCNETGDGYCSHFELYLTAMRAIGANTQNIQALLKKLAEGGDVISALRDLNLPASIQNFVQTTFDFFHQDTAVLAAAFVYGREAITPSLFTPMVMQLQRALNVEDQEAIETLLYYLKRHIALDGDQHLPKALQMLENIAGQDHQIWQVVSASASRALHARFNFLNGIQSAIHQSSCLA